MTHASTWAKEGEVRVKRGTTSAVSAEAVGVSEKVGARDDYTRRLREVARVRSFFESNPRLWHELCDKTERHIESGVPFGIHEVIEHWRWFRPTTSDGSELKINNSWSPIVARLIVEKYPEADELIERRRSQFDAVFDGRGSDAEPSLA